jgi:hypothetical protein
MDPALRDFRKSAFAVGLQAGYRQEIEGLLEGNVGQ